MCALFLMNSWVGHASIIDKTANVPADVTSGASLPQNTLAYLPSQQTYTIAKSVRQDLASHYLTRYFSPWTGKHWVNSPAEIKQMFHKVHQGFLANPGWGANHQRHTAKWVQQIVNNTDWANFPNRNQKAITVRENSVRLLPTHDPSFTDWHTNTTSYPFDNIQQSFISANTPVVVLHTSKDGAWYLLVTPNYIGWVDSSTIAFVKPAFIKSWQTAHYIVATQDATITPPANTNIFPLPLRLGTLYPLHQQSATAYTIYTAVSNESHYAILKKVAIPKRLASLFPEPISSKNIAIVANQMMGNPYGWGGMYGYRDCSSTLMDLMSVFGIWLPRNSGDQANAGTSISLQGLTDAQKKQIILAKGVPFLTLLHYPGHILLYIGTRKGKPYVYQDVWRFRGTVITPLQMEDKASGVTLLSILDKMTVVLPIS